MNQSMEFEFVAGARRNCELIYTPCNKQLYKFKSEYKNKKNEVHRRYVCYQKGCKASITLINKKHCCQKSDNAVHSDNHSEQETQMNALQLKSAIKREVSRPTLQVNKLRTIFNAECRKKKDSAKHVVYRKMQRNLRRIKSAAMPKSPQSPQDFINIFNDPKLMKEYGMCESNPEHPFYQTTVVEEDFAYTLFFSVPIGNLIKNVDECDRHFLIDATFSVVPSCGFKQLLIIYFGHDRHVFPFAFILMTKKSLKSYEHVFRFINSNLLELKPKTFITDFEKALRNSLRRVFPEVRLKGCWFHFCQAMRRKLGKMSELAKKIRCLDDAKKIFQKLLALPLLPAQEIEKAFIVCKKEAYAKPKLYTKSGNVFEKFLDYFEHQWLQMETPANFSVHDECVRTTSAVEGYNSYLSAQIPMHGSFWDFLQVIRHEEFQKHTELEQALEGVFEIFERPKKRIRDRSTQIKKLTEKLNLGEISPNTFLNMMTNKTNDFLPPLSENSQIIDNIDSSSESESDTPPPEGVLCEICFKNKKNTVMKPCRHAKICRSCFDEIQQVNNERSTLTLCPFCRQIVGAVEEIYI